MSVTRSDEKHVRVLVLTGFGLNCDFETAHAFELAGAVSTRVHINTLIAGDDDFKGTVTAGAAEEQAVLAAVFQAFAGQNIAFMSRHWPAFPDWI